MDKQPPEKIPWRPSLDFYLDEERLSGEKEERFEKLLDDWDFKAVNDGLGFHHPSPLKPRPSPSPEATFFIPPSPRKSPVPSSPPLASWPLRFLAYLVDLCLFAAVGVLFFLLGARLLAHTWQEFFSLIFQPEWGAYFWGILLLIYLFYFSLMDSQQTLGKKILGLRVVGPSTRPPTLPHLLFRSVLSLFGLQEQTSLRVVEVHAPR